MLKTFVHSSSNQRLSAVLPEKKIVKIGSDLPIAKQNPDFLGRRKFLGESLAKTASSHQDVCSNQDEQGTPTVGQVCSQRHPVSNA